MKNEMIVILSTFRPSYNIAQTSGIGLFRATAGKWDASIVRWGGLP